jgi:hypothetical protein
LYNWVCVTAEVKQIIRNPYIAAIKLDCYCKYDYDNSTLFKYKSIDSIMLNRLQCPFKDLFTFERILLNTSRE